jgi:hypothetical protein
MGLSRYFGIRYASSHYVTSKHLPRIFLRLHYAALILILLLTKLTPLGASFSLHNIFLILGQDLLVSQKIMQLFRDYAEGIHFLVYHY